MQHGQIVKIIKNALNVAMTKLISEEIYGIATDVVMNGDLEHSTVKNVEL